MIQEQECIQRTQHDPQDLQNSPFCKASNIHLTYLHIQTLGFWCSLCLKMPIGTAGDFTHVPNNTGPAENWLKLARAESSMKSFTAGTAVNSGTKPGSLQHKVQLSAPSLAYNITPSCPSVLS